MCKIERNGETDGAVRIEPLLRQPDRRLHLYSAAGKFAEDLVRALLDRCAT